MRNAILSGIFMLSFAACDGLAGKFKSFSTDNSRTTETVDFSALGRFLPDQMGTLSAHGPVQGAFHQMGTTRVTSVNRTYQSETGVVMISVSFVSGSDQVLQPTLQNQALGPFRPTRVGRFQAYECGLTFFVSIPNHIGVTLIPLSYGRLMGTGNETDPPQAASVAAQLDLEGLDALGKRYD